MNAKNKSGFALKIMPLLCLLGGVLTLKSPAENVYQATLTTPSDGGGAQLLMGRFYFRVEADEVDFVALIFPFGSLSGGLDPSLSGPGASINFSLGTGERNWFHGGHTIADHNPFLPHEPWLPTGYDQDGNPFYVDHAGIQIADVYTGQFSLPSGFEADLLAGFGRIEFNSMIVGAITVASVPEPTTLSLALLAGLGWCARSRWRKSRASHLAVLLVVLSCGSGVARADTIVSSLDNVPVTSVVSPVVFSYGSWAASSFQTDNQYWNLSSVTLLLGGFGSSTADLRLYSDASNQPGVSLVDLGSLTVSSGGALSPVTFTLAGGFILEPSTTYWIALGSISLQQTLNVGVLFDDPFAFTGVPGASMTYSATSSVGNGVNPPTAWQTPGPNVALLFAVDGTVVVPEPTTLSLALLAGLGWCARCRWQKSK